MAKSAMNRAAAAQEEVDRLRAALDALARRVWRGEEGSAAVPAAGPAEPALSEVEGSPPPEPEPEVAPPPQPAGVDAREPAGEDAGAPIVEPAAAFEAPSPPVIPPPRPPFDWESLIGVKLFSWIAGIALVMAALFFLRYSVEHGWLRPAVRAVIGIATGAALIAICEMKVARPYKFTANAMHGAGIAILYSTLFAIYALWHLASATVVFGGMILVTAVAVGLAIVRNSIFIALLGLLGGFATPAMLSTGENRPFGLFTYLLLLNVGLAWVAMKKRWPLLTAISIAFTVIYQWAWVGTFLTASQFPLAAGIFLTFAASSTIALWFGRSDDGKQRTFDVAAVGGAALPLLFAFVGAAVPAYGAHYNLLFGFLLLITAGLSLIGIRRGPGWLHIVGGIVTVLVFILWSAISYRQEAWPVVLAWLAAFVLLQLAAAHFTELPSFTVAPALFLMFPIVIGIEKATASPLLVFAVLFTLLAIVAAYAILHDAGIVYFLAAFFTIAAEAVWSAKYLTPERLHGALAIYGIFAVFFLGVPLIARRFDRTFTPRGAIAILLLASIAMLFFLAAGPVAKSALWGLALLLAVVNMGAMFEARTSTRPLLAMAGIALSWIVIAVWSFNSMSAVNLIPALAVVGGFGVLAVAGNLWAARDSDKGSGFVNATFLGLVGHVFLLFVAGQKALAFPPWPLFAVLFVLDLAIGIAAIYTRREKLMLGAMGASQLVLMIWAANATVSPWPLVALGAAIAVAAMALAWFAINRSFAGAAIIALFLGDVVVMIAGKAAIFWPVLMAHLVLLVAILAIAWITEEHAIATVAVPLLAIGTALARTSSPAQQFALSGAIFAAFLAYPLLLGGRAKRSIQPYLAAVLASVPFFFFARDAMRDAHLDFMIGALPVVEAVLMLLLVVRLLKMERVLSRLALVSAAALAFITVAIPLQLDKQWITIGWALEGAALVWLFNRIPHRGLLAWSGALLAAVFVRLVFNSAVFAYHPQQHQAIVNWYLYTYLVAAASFFAAAWLLPRDDPWRRLALPALNAAGAVLLFFLLNIEIADFYSHGPVLTFNFFSSSLAQDLTYTIGWALFAVVMLIAGIRLRSRATRIAAIVLLLATVAKCFIHDLWRLGGLYRVGSFLGLAISLVLVGVLLQRFVMIKNTAAETP
ncbi:MAG: DUF2339 domain-containing protein [Acidobacteriota bacterium]